MDRQQKYAAGGLAAAVLASMFSAAAPALAAPAPPAPGTSEMTSVIVRERLGSGDASERTVTALGGSVGRQLAIINGFSAAVPSDRLTELRRSAAVESVTLNSPVEMLDDEDDEQDDDEYDGYRPSSDPGSMYNARKAIGAEDFFARGYTGTGVSVALLDSGVVPVDGLTVPGKVKHGPDLSLESQASDRRNLDTFGHGTHMAGIIAGRDNDSPRLARAEDDYFVGMAPGAHLVSVKLADAQGATDVSQVIAAIDWVVEHKNDPGMKIRVLNLSFGTDGVQDYQLDPLTYAAEVAWRKGIVAVGGADGRQTYSVNDDVIGSFSSYGDAARAPDLVAPGKSVVSLKAPGSTLDLAHPGAAVGTRQMRGSGTSQAAAMVSGAAALIIEQRPGITPDQVKALLKDTARELPAANSRAQGAGISTSGGR